MNEAVSNLRADLAPLADDIRAATDDLDTFSTSGGDLNDELVVLVDSVDEVRTAVSGTSEVIAQAQASSDAAHDLAESTLSEIGNQRTLSRLLLVIIAIAIAVGQIVPYSVSATNSSRPRSSSSPISTRSAVTTSTRSPPTSTRSRELTQIAKPTEINGEDRAEGLARDVVGMRRRQAQDEQCPQIVATDAHT